MDPSSNVLEPTVADKHRHVFEQNRTSLDGSTVDLLLCCRISPRTAAEQLLIGVRLIITGENTQPFVQASKTLGQHSAHLASLQWPQSARHETFVDSKTQVFGMIRSRYSLNAEMGW